MLDPSHFPYNVASGQMHSIFRQIHKLLTPRLCSRDCAVLLISVRSTSAGVIAVLAFTSRRFKRFTVDFH